METWQLILLIVLILSATAAFIWNALKVNTHHHNQAKKGELANKLEENADVEVEHIFNDDFRQELRNRGRLHFEKIIGENAMFLQQDLRLTTSQLNEYMKQEVTRTLQEEFAKYEQSITDAKQLAIHSLEKTRETIEQQRQILSEQLQAEVQTAKKQIIERFETNMADIVNHYLLLAVGNQISLDDQLEYILGDLEKNKKAIIEDITSGA